MIKEFKGEYAFLSNFFPTRSIFEGEIYDSVEAAYQAAKTLDLDSRAQFIGLTASQAKKLGRTVAIRSDWDDYRVFVMAKLLLDKFSKEPLQKKLLATGDQELQEGNYWGDTFWGVDLKTGKGENNLGRLLMMIRAIYVDMNEQSEKKENDC